jgi:hypothetical protein
MRLPDQRSFISNFVERISGRLIKFGIDANGIGLNIAEDIEDISYELVVRQPFNQNAWKEEACREMKYRMESSKIVFPSDRRYLGQIHSIRRILLAGNTWRFDSEATSHHADEFWGTIAGSMVGHSVIATSHNDEIDKRAIGPKISAARTPEIYAPNVENIVRYNPYGNMPTHRFGGFGSMKAPSYPGISFSNRIRPVEPFMIGS